MDANPYIPVPAKLVDVVEEMIGLVKSNQSRIRNLEMAIDLGGVRPDFMEVRNDFYAHRDQVDHSKGK